MGGMGSGGGGYGGQGGYVPGPTSETLSTPAEPPKPTYSAPASRKPQGSSRAMKLGGKAKDVDSFVDQLVSEGEKVTEVAHAGGPASSGGGGGGQSKPASSKMPPAMSAADTESVHAKMEEKINAVCSRDGGLESMELSGMLSLRISDEALGRVRLQLVNPGSRGVQLQTHPNIDKDLLRRQNQIGLKNPAKPFPLNTDVGVLKWRFQTTDESNLPLSSELLSE